MKQDLDDLKKLTVRETAKLTGISVRTLHYYDEIELLKPTVKTEAGYRYYDKEALAVLQEILLYRELDFSLKEIKEILSMPDYDRRKALKALITKYYYPCTDEILAGLGEMYVADGRFMENIDRSGQGTAAFMSEAIKAYCSK